MDIRFSGHQRKCFQADGQLLTLFMMKDKSDHSQATWVIDRVSNNLYANPSRHVISRKDFVAARGLGLKETQVLLIMSVSSRSSDSSWTALVASSSKGDCTSLSHCYAKFLSSVCRLVTVTVLSYTTRHLLSPSSADLRKVLVWIRGKFLGCRRTFFLFWGSAASTSKSTSSCSSIFSFSQWTKQSAQVYVQLQLLKYFS